MHLKAECSETQPDESVLKCLEVSIPDPNGTVGSSQKDNSKYYNNESESDTKTEEILIGVGVAFLVVGLLSCIVFKCKKGYSLEKGDGLGKKSQDVNANPRD